MDLKAQIEQLDKVIENFDSNIETMKDNRKVAFNKRKSYLKLLTAAEAVESMAINQASC